MRPILWVLAGGVVVVSLVFISCTSNEAHRTCYKPDPTGEEIDHAVIESTDDYKLGFVEFDDQGWFWDDRQLPAVQEMIRNEARAHESQGHGIIVVVFVHGWKHNASHDDDNVVMLRGVLQQLSEAEKADATVQKRPPRPIVAVYGGWRGLSSAWEPFKELSFWDRKNTAECVGHGAMTQMLSSLEDLQLESNRHVPVGAPRTELVIVGHSFGGAAVYSALSQIMTERFMEATRLHRPARSVGDLVVLLNPAFEAARHYSLNDLAVSVNRYPPTQRPIFAVFTSEGDWATHYAFSIGRCFSTLFESDRSDKPQGTANRTAIGWFEPFITHKLVYDVNRKAPPAATAPAAPVTPTAPADKRRPKDFQGLVESVQRTHTLRAKWESAFEKPVDLDFDECVLQPLPSYKPGDPLYVVSVDSRIMSGHTDIANDLMLNFLREFILFCRPNALKQQDP
jgi:hypothetical protein